MARIGSPMVTNRPTIPHSIDRVKARGLLASKSIFPPGGKHSALMASMAFLGGALIGKGFALYPSWLLFSICIVFFVAAFLHGSMQESKYDEAVDALAADLEHERRKF